MKIATFNANSIRARLDTVIDWLATNEPDVLAVQETKVEDAKFPVEEFEGAGWQVAFHGQKSYNGVALLSRHPILNVTKGFGDLTWPEDCRLIVGEVQGIPILNTYVPNGSAVGSEKFDYKLRWLERFGEFVAKRFSGGNPAVWLGDINIAPTPDDVFEPKKHEGKVGFHPLEKGALGRLTTWGWVDLFREFHEGPGHYTFWEFVIPKAFERNLGWRIDHVYATSRLAERCVSCAIDREPRGWERPSDHTFVVAEFDV
ncbi:MAG: exodeoxyribonuclease III [Armatimonadetes bacterium]|nr:exodeoxyribonuclease III [Armatimonadota bacterium]NOG38412.1 exodeoxyribonuclease III [Armatimonadota bacterium]